MEAQVDAGSACVRLGDESWPFELDCRDASALVEVGGRALRVRPLRWREKLSLARFAHLGSSFVAAQQLRIALDDAPAPAVEEERAVLAALAAWVAAPGDAIVPFEPRALAGVTVDVCRAVGLKPADLDGRDAYEVEALWRVAAGRVERLPVEAVSASRIFEPPPGTWESEFTRIEIVADRGPLSEQAEPAPETSKAAPPRPTTRTPASDMLSLAGVRADPRSRPRELAAVREFAVVTPPAPVTARREEPAVEAPAARAADNASDKLSLAEGEAASLLPGAVAGGSSAGQSVAGWRFEASRVGRPDDVVTSSEPELRPAAVAAAAQDPEQIFDELADRLERAASALGVDLEA